MVMCMKHARTTGTRRHRETTCSEVKTLSMMNCEVLISQTCENSAVNLF